MKKNTCNCGKENKIICSNCSVIKMVILLKRGNNDLKYKSTCGRFINPVWYNNLSKNRKPKQKIINAMTRRFLKSKYKNVTNMIAFYDNTTKELIKRVTIT